MRKISLMAVLLVLSIAGVSLADLFGSGANQFTIDFIPISAGSNPAIGQGIVNYDYRIGKYEITNGQWMQFVQNLGASPKGDPTAAYDQTPYFYDGVDMPANRISWYEAAQFVNWLNTSTDNQPAYKFTGTQGQSDYSLALWQPQDAGYNPDNPYRNSNAYYFLPSEDEWIKAAYWNGSELQNYATAAGDNLYQGNGSEGGWNYWYGGDTGPAGTETGPWNAGSSSQELNGTFDMMGNLWEWVENPYSGTFEIESNRSIYGGAYGYNSTYLTADNNLEIAPDSESMNISFRVASVPEPTPLFLFSIGALLIRKKCL